MDDVPPEVVAEFEAWLNEYIKQYTTAVEGFLAERDKNLEKRGPKTLKSK